MKLPKNLATLIFSGLIIFLPFTQLPAQEAGETVTKRGVVNDDYYAAGGTVDVDADITGDLVTAGGTITIDRLVRGDVMVAGGDITIKGRILDDIRAAGGSIRVDARIGDDLIAAGGSVKISPRSRIGGSAWLAGGEIEMAGTVREDLRIAARKVIISGTVRGNVDIKTGDLQITDSARINGNLTYRSPHKASIPAGARIRGKVMFTQIERYQPKRYYRLASILTLSVAGIVLFLVFPGFTISSANRIATNFWVSLGLGFAILVATPLAAVILMAIYLGVWVGLPLLAVYLASLPVAFLVGAFFVGDWGARIMKLNVSTRGKRIVSLIAAVIVLTLLRFIPVAGGLVTLLVLTLGLGAGTLQLHQLYLGGMARPKTRAKTKKTKAKKRKTR